MNRSSRITPSSGAVFAAAENFIITAKSDAIQIPPTPNALLAAGTTWYFDRAMARAALRRRQIADDADTESLLRAAQGVTETLPPDTCGCRCQAERASRAGRLRCRWPSDGHLGPTMPD